MCTANAPCLLEFAAVSHRYGQEQGGLDACTLRIAAGSRNALIGCNGAGKTTLLLHAVGLLRPEQGEVRFAGQPLNYQARHLHTLRRRVGLVFQNPDHQLFAATVSEDISFGPLNLGLPVAEVRQRVARAMQAVALTPLAETPLHQLSFGQKKRVCIAGVLAMQPDLLLLDEPMAGLDQTMQAEFAELLTQLGRQGITILLSTHDLDFAYAWADHIHLLDRGQCRASLASHELPRHAEALCQMGQTLPSVLTLHQALVARGILPPQPAPRSQRELLALLAAPAFPPQPASCL